jgi:Na+/H+-dicarboxylate symporter
MAQSKHGKLTKWIIGSLVAGFGLGLFLNLTGLAESTQSWLVDGILQFGSQAFVRLLQFLVVPVVLVSLVCGVASLKDIREFGSIAGKTVFIYLLTTAAAIAVALLVALIVRPGVGFDLAGEQGGVFTAKETPSLLNTFLGIVPNNLFAAFAQAEMLQVIFIAIILGLAISLSGQPGKNLLGWFQNLNTVVIKLVEMIIWISPIGVFCLMTRVFAMQGFEAFEPLLKYFFTVLGVLLIHTLVFYPMILKVFAGLSPIQFFKKFKSTMVFAFSTSSSNATIPVTLESVETKLGVDNRVASFTIPFGATVNMDGTAIMQGVATVFIAQASGIEIGLIGYLTVILTATLASIGTAGVPSVGLVTLALVLKSVGLPIEGIAVILAVDRLLDMTRTVTNITGDAVTSCIVARSEGALDQKIFNSKNLS